MICVDFVDYLIELGEKGGLNQELWNDLVLAAATSHGSSVATFRQRLMDNLNSIFPQWNILSCTKLNTFHDGGISIGQRVDSPYMAGQATRPDGCFFFAVVLW